VESSCEFGNEPSGFMKCWESGLTSSGLSSSAQLHRVSQLISYNSKLVYVNLNV
jgi:hypothetical protein